MNIKIFLITLLIASSTCLFSQTQKQLDEKREEIKRLFGDNFFKDMEEFDKRYQELMKELFESGHAGQGIFEDEVLDQFMNKMKPHENMADNDFKWIETDKQKILMLKFTQAKNSPLNISIEEGMIQISGTITQKEENKKGAVTSYSSFTSTFNRSFPVPEDVLERTAKIDNKKGEIVISFDKKTSKKP